MSVSLNRPGCEYETSAVKIPRWKLAINILLPVVLILGFCLIFKGIDSCPHADSVTVAPNTGVQGQSLAVVITDTAATSDERRGLVDLDFGQGITVVRDWSIFSPTNIYVNIVIAPDAVLGPRNIISTHNPGGIYSLANAFTVVAPPPVSTISSTTNSSTGSAAGGTGPQSTISLPNLQVQSASLSTSRVVPGTPVTVTANIVNKSTVNGTMNVKLYVNGQQETNRGITVDSGKIVPLTFNVSRNQPGTYAVYVGGVSAGSFTVDEFADGNIILIISISLLAVALIIGAIYILRRKQNSY